MARDTRPRQARGEDRTGETFEVTVGPVAHGGHCVARLPFETVAGQPPQGPGRVLFVRHAIPGERALVRVTEGTDGDRFWRADAIEVLDPSADRVTPPCPFAGPGRCGGCDFQHVDLAAQRVLKASVVREQMSRLAKLDVDVTVEPVPGDADGLDWRTRMQYAVAPGGGRGMRKHRSRAVLPIDECRIAHPHAIEQPAGGVVTEQVRHRAFEVAADGFWQVHPGAPETLVGAVLDVLDPQPGETALDLYAGVGLFAAFLGEAVGESGRVVAIEGNRAACGHAADNLADLPHTEVALGSVDRVLATSYDEPVDLVVLDPPREGAKRKVVHQIADRSPRAVAYVACDPAALARDIGWFAERGYGLTSLRAFDLFPMTHHTECVALLEPADVCARPR